MAEWQPIDTAPKDGTRVILSWGGKSISGYFLDNSRTATPWAGWSVASMVVRPAGQPTHWQPFPPPHGMAAAESRRPLTDLAHEAGFGVDSDGTIYVHHKEGICTKELQALVALLTLGVPTPSKDQP